MKNTIVLLILVFSATQIIGQSYDTAAGMRLGTEWGLTVKQRIAKKTTLEAILQSSLQREEFTVTVLGEQHRAPILDTRSCRENPRIARRYGVIHPSFRQLGEEDRIEAREHRAEAPEEIDEGAVMVLSLVHREEHRPGVSRVQELDTSEPSRSGAKELRD